MRLRARGSYLRRRLRAWLAASIHRRVVAALLAKTLAFTFFVSTATFFLARWQLQRTVSDALAADASRLADHFAIPLTTAGEVLESLAGSPPLARALLDRKARLEEAETFLRNLPTTSTLPLEFTLCDLQGEPVATSDRVDAQEGRAECGRAATPTGLPRAELIDHEGLAALRMSHPVLNPGTGRPAGTIQADVDLVGMLAAPAQLSEGRRRLLAPGGRVLLEQGAVQATEALLTAQADLPTAARLGGPTLTAEVSLPRAAALRPLAWLSAFFAAGAAIMVLLALLVARALATRLTGPITSLAEAAGRVAATGQAGAGLPVHGTDEVARLAQAFNEMLARLHQATEARLTELRERNVELQRIHAESKRLEVELHQAQKLEAVGQLAAGIAHEINTPIQYISDNTRFLEDAVASLSARAQRLSEVAAAHAPPEVQRALADEAETLDLEYILEQAGPTIRRTLDGTQRVATIVRAMKEFAHPDQREMVATDLNRALKATLEVSRNEYRYVADVETDLQPLPLVTCHPGEVNQVFLNVIVNAAHAIGGEVKGTERRGLIEVRTRSDGAWVEIEVADDGPGIPEAIRGRVFEPFFTTKEVGRGTGQGLAIARSVVEKHGGAIRFQSAPGLGTTFSIRLPVAGPALERTA